MSFLVNWTIMRLALCFALMLAARIPAQSLSYVSSTLRPPSPPREFRGVWVATVNNIDWPSRSGLTTAQQKAELLAILDRAAQLRLNAVFFQVRAACDAFYNSRYEPWSEYLTGRMGQAPKPYYDPLEFVVTEAHRRGLELHAWFNPFRARYSGAASPVARNHVSLTRPHLVVKYGSQWWLDPGQPETQDYSVNVILDVVKRYDIDGVHIDDYFYPYPERGDGKNVDFPDTGSWRRYVASGGKAGRDDWRRSNVDRFVHRLNGVVHAQKPPVKFSVSPFGIWRPGYPAQIKGLDAYAELYADARKWLAGGWMDFMVPQLYWSSREPAQSFPVLLKWWAEQNAANRHVWPGIAVTRVTQSGWGASEIVRQVKYSRDSKGAHGQVFWNASSLMANKGGVADALRREVYAGPALPPEVAWRARSRCQAPKLTWRDTGRGGLRVSWSATGGDKPHRWLVQRRAAGTWTWQVLAASQTSMVFDVKSGAPDAVAVVALDRVGNAGVAAAIERVRTQAALPLPESNEAGAGGS